MNVNSQDVNLAFDFITTAVKAMLQAQGTNDGIHIMVFGLDLSPTLIAERAFGEPGKPGRKYRDMTGIKVAETVEKQMSIQELRLIDPDHLDRLRIHDGSVIDKTNRFGVACSGAGSAGNIIIAEMVRRLALQMASARIPETIAAE